MCWKKSTILSLLIVGRYLRDLQNQARGKIAGDNESSRSSSSTGEQTLQTPCFSDEVPVFERDQSTPKDTSHASELAPSIWASPFTLPSSVIKDAGTTKRNWRKFYIT